MPQKAKDYTNNNIISSFEEIRDNIVHIQNTSSDSTIPTNTDITRTQDSWFEHSAFGSTTLGAYSQLSKHINDYEATIVELLNKTNAEYDEEESVISKEAKQTKQQLTDTQTQQASYTKMIRIENAIYLRSVVENMYANLLLFVERLPWYAHIESLTQNNMTSFGQHMNTLLNLMAQKEIILKGIQEKQDAQIQQQKEQIVQSLEEQQTTLLDTKQEEFDAKQKELASQYNTLLTTQFRFDDISQYLQYAQSLETQPTITTSDVELIDPASLSIILGTAIFERDNGDKADAIIQMNASNPRFMKENDTNVCHIELPYIQDLSQEFNLIMAYDDEVDEFIDPASTLDIITTRLLGTLPTDKTHLDIIDPNGLGNKFPKTKNFIVEHNMNVDGIHVVEDDIEISTMNVIKKIADMSWNQEKISSEFNLISIADFPHNFTYAAMKNLLRILENSKQKQTYVLMTVDINLWNSLCEDEQYKKLLHQIFPYCLYIDSVDDNVLHVGSDGLEDVYLTIES